jgi:hypothetical protein
MLPVIPIGNYSRLELIYSIHPVNQPEAIEALDIIERRSIGLIHQDPAFDIFAINGLDGCAGGFCEW